MLTGFAMVYELGMQGVGFIGLRTKGFITAFGSCFIESVTLIGFI